MGAGASVDVPIHGELAKVLSASDGDLAAAAEKVNREIVRVVPKTRSGRFDPEHGERAAVLQVVERANLLAQHGYAVSWAYYNKPEDGARRDGEDLLEDTRRLEEDFTPDEPPRCALPEGASVGASVAAIVELAKRHGRALIESLKGLVQDAGGSYVWGPRKKEGRIREKAEKEYGGDVARVVDVERATGVFDSVDDLSLAITRLKRASRRGDITIRRCKDHFGHPFDTGYRDLQFNIELDGFVGELQLNLRKIIDVKKQAHAAYEVERVLKAGTGRGALERAVDGPGLESEQVLRLTIDGGRSVIDDAFGSLAMFEAALARALPRGCVVANVYSGDQGVVLVRLGVDNVAAMAQLRDDVILGSAFEEALRRVTPRWERPVTDDELRGLGFEECTAGDGRSFYFKLKGDAKPWDRPTVVLPATRRPATDEELESLGYHEHRTRDDRSFYVHRDANEAQWQRPIVTVPATTRPATHEELDLLGYDELETGDGRKFYVHRDSSEMRQVRPIVNSVETKISVDRAAFLECYSRTMMGFTKLTPHQREKLQEVRAATVAVLLSPAGGGKTFVAIQRVLAELRGDAGAEVLFIARNTALALFVCKWLVAASQKSAEHVVDRVHVLVAPFADGPRRVRVEGRRLVLDAVGEAVKYALVVVDEAHHLVNDAALRAQLADIGAAQTRLLLLADASQATATLAKDAIARSLVELPQDQEVVVATLSEVVRSTKRIVAGAAAFQLEAGRKAETSTHGASAGPPLVARVFTTSEGDDAGEIYAREVVEALAAIRRQLVDLEDLDDRVAVVGPDEAFIQKLREPLARALGGFELVDAATASAVLPRGDTEARTVDAKQLLVVDSVDNMDGLERLVVICVGLDQVIDRGAGVLETRSRLYRAMTRAQLAVAVVNEALPGGWLEFLGCVELDAGTGFDDAAERGNRAETAADDVVGAVVEETSAPVATHGDATAVSKASLAPARGSDGAQGASPNDAVDAPVAEKAMADADAAATPSEAEPIKVLQSIWDASAVSTASSRDNLRFMPFFELDPSKLVELRTLQGHSHYVLSVAISPDGRRVVSASIDNTLKVWDVATGKCVATLKGHSSQVNGVAVFPDGRRVVSCDGDFYSHTPGVLKVWDIETGECVATLEGHSKAVSSVAVFPDGRRVVSASSDKTLKVWDVATGECVATLEGHSKAVWRVAVFPDGRRVVSASGDKTLKVWDVATGECVATLEGHSGSVNCVAISPDGRRIVSGSDDNTLKVWDVATGECLATLEGHSNTVWGVAVFPDGRRVVSCDGYWNGGKPGVLKVWDVETGKCVATLEGHSSFVRGVAISPDGRRVVSASEDKTLKLWGINK